MFNDNDFKNYFSNLNVFNNIFLTILADKFCKPFPVQQNDDDDDSDDDENSQYNSNGNTDFD